MTMRGAFAALLALASAEAQRLNSTNTTGVALDTGLSVALLPPVRFNTRGIAYPDFRYTPWDELDSSVKMDATIAGCKWRIELCTIRSIVQLVKKSHADHPPIQTLLTPGTYQERLSWKCIRTNPSSFSL